MDKKQIKRLIKQLETDIKNLENLAISKGIDISSEEFDELVLELKAKFLAKKGLTIEEYEELKREIEKKKGIKIEGVEMIKGNKGDPGEKGYTPIKGKDYFDGKDANEDEIIEKVLKRIPPPQKGEDGKTIIKTKEIVREYNKDEINILKNDLSYLQESFINFSSDLKDVKSVLADNDELLKKNDTKIWEETENKLNLIRQTISRMTWGFQNQIDEVKVLVNNENLFDRSVTTLSPHNSGDDLDLLTGDFTTTGEITGHSAASVIYIAASDSTASSKARANYVCDGTEDETEINTAISSLGSIGGMIKLLEGNFYIQTATIEQPESVFIRGVGPDATIIQPHASHTLTPGDALITLTSTNTNYQPGGISELTLQGDGTTTLGTATIDGLGISAGITGSLYYYYIDHCNFIYCAKGIDWFTPSSIRYAPITNNKIWYCDTGMNIVSHPNFRNNEFRYCGYCIYFDSGAVDVELIGNKFNHSTNGIVKDGGTGLSYSIINSNMFANNTDTDLVIGQKNNVCGNTFLKTTSKYNGVAGIKIMIGRNVVSNNRFVYQASAGWTSGCILWGADPARGEVSVISDNLFYNPVGPIFGLTDNLRKFEEVNIIGNTFLLEGYDIYTGLSSNNYWSNVNFSDNVIKLKANMGSLGILYIYAISSGNIINNNIFANDNSYTCAYVLKGNFSKTCIKNNHFDGFSTVCDATFTTDANTQIFGNQGLANSTNIVLTATLQAEHLYTTDDLQVDDDILLGSGSVINWDSGDFTITHSANNLTFAGGSITIDTSEKLYFRDANTYIYSSNSGILDIVASSEIRFNNAAADADITLTFVGTTNTGTMNWFEDEDYFRFYDDVLIASSENIYFRDTAISINSADDGHLDLTADTSIDLNANVVLADSKTIDLDLAPASDVNATGISATMTVDAGTGSTAVGQAYHIDTDGELVDADADGSATMPCMCLAMATGTGSKKVLLQGAIRNDAWNWTIGGMIYVSTDPTTTTGLTQTAPSGSGDFVQIVGVALTADIIYFNPSYNMVEIV